MAVKLDLASAFDEVRHKFPFGVMQQFGFDFRFISWVKACIAEPWIAPLVNERSADFFKASQGIKQGCPLSPLLYVIQGSFLSFMLEKR